MRRRIVQRWNKPLHWCIERRVQGACAAHGDLLLQHFDALGQEVDEKSAMVHTFGDHFGRSVQEANGGSVGSLGAVLKQHNLTAALWRAPLLRLGVQGHGGSELPQ
jgi:hypothetical protein